MLKTERLTIKPYIDADQEDMISILTNSMVRKTFIIPDFESHAKAVCMFKKLMACSYSEDHYEKGIYREDKLIGFVNDVKIDKDSIEIGYVIHPDYHNQGYATEALKAVISDLFNKGFSQVTAATFDYNTASRRVMEKCGMKLTDKAGTIMHNGVLNRCVYYSLNKFSFKIISVSENPYYSEKAVDWFSSKWGIERKEYEESISDCITRINKLPKWYLALDAEDNIIGGCGLIQNDFVDRTDLYPYLCALFVEKQARGHSLGGKLLNYARTEAAKMGFDMVYLCTDHTSYYERYGWEYHTQGHHHDGSISRIYRAASIV